PSRTATGAPWPRPLRASKRSPPAATRATRWCRTWRPRWWTGSASRRTPCCRSRTARRACLTCSTGRARPRRCSPRRPGRAMRLRGRPALRVSAGAFLRPASLRLERGRADPDVFYEDWLDARGLTREVLDPLAAGGTGRVLPALWDPVADRATRSAYVEVPPGGVLLLDGALLLGIGLPLDVTVHLAMSAAALAR